MNRTDLEIKFHEEPDHETCDVCGKLMLERQSIDPDALDGMAAYKKLNSIFACPSMDAEWHQQLIALIKKARSTPSARLAQIYSEEAELIRQNKMVTKESWE